MSEVKLMDFLLDKLAKNFSSGVKEVKIKESIFISHPVIKQLSDEGFKVRVISNPKPYLVVS